jgi:hypothetical protein
MRPAMLFLKPTNRFHPEIGDVGHWCLSAFSGTDYSTLTQGRDLLTDPAGNPDHGALARQSSFQLYCSRADLCAVPSAGLGMCVVYETVGSFRRAAGRQPSEANTFSGTAQAVRLWNLYSQREPDGSRRSAPECDTRRADALPLAKGILNS